MAGRLGVGDRPFLCPILAHQQELDHGAGPRQAGLSCRRLLDINVVETRALPTPAELLAELPKTEPQAEFVTRTRREIHRSIFTDDKRFSLIVGPVLDSRRCAGHDYAVKMSASLAMGPTRDCRDARVLRKTSNAVGF